MKTEVRIAAWTPRNGNVREHRAATWAEGGLAVTRGLNEQGWAVTHVASGYALFWGLRTATIARNVARRALELGDWTVSRTQLEKSRELKAKALSLRAELREEGIVVA